MSLLDWIARRQRDKLPVTSTMRSVEETVSSIERKVVANQDAQLRASTFSTVKQRDSLVMQRVLGQQPVKGV